MNISKEYKQASLWGIIHGLNDLTAGYMLASFSFNHNRESAVSMLILYGILAFAGQLPLGMWLDKVKSIKPFAVTGLIILFLSIFCYFFDPVIGIILTGIAGAGIHVVGGTICLQLNNEKFGLLGIFTAPGVIGLTIGGLLAGISIFPLMITGLMLVVISGKILHSGFPSYRKQISQDHKSIDSHDWIMLGLLVLMCFRSLTFDLINIIGENYEYGALVLGVSAFTGKIIGGFAADKFGWKQTVYAGLSLAFIFLQFGKQNIYALGFAIACLQSSVPVTLAVMCRALKSTPATAVAFSLGTSVAFAGLPLFFISVRPNFILQLTFNGGWVLILILLIAYFRNRRRLTRHHNPQQRIRYN